MNAVIGVLLAILVYPGLLVALLAAWASTWVRTSVFGAAQGRPVSALAFTVRTAFDKEGIARQTSSSGNHRRDARRGSPPAARADLPKPGNLMVSAVGLG
jgi:hypothetical protein